MVASLPSNAICSGSRGTRTHNSLLANTCFRDRPLIRSDDFLFFRCLQFRNRELRGLESNQRPPGSGPGVTTSSNCPAPSKFLPPAAFILTDRSAASVALPAATAPHCFHSTSRALAGGESSGRRIRTFIACFKGRKPTVSRSPSAHLLNRSHSLKCPAGVEPASPAWKAGTFAARSRARFFHRRKPWDSNPQASLARRLFSRQVPHPAGWLPSSRETSPFLSSAAAAGIEPASGRLTAACPYQHGPHRNETSHSGEPAG
jgi:hypothetical protein